MSLSNLSRRELLARVLIGATAISGMADSQATSEKLNPDDPAAKNVGYVEDATRVDIRKYPTYVKGHTCANCTLALSAYGPVRPCKLFPGKIVIAKGWCSAWAQRPPGT